MIDEETGEKYARAVGHKGIGSSGERDWFIKDMYAELKAWGHSGGTNGHIIMKSDGEASVVALRKAVAEYHGGRVSPEVPAKGESQDRRSRKDRSRIHPSIEGTDRRKNENGTRVQ